MSETRLAIIAHDVKNMRKQLEDGQRCYKRELDRSQYAIEAEACDRILMFHAEAIDKIGRIEKWLDWAMSDNEWSAE